MNTALKEYVIIYDSQGEQFDIWTSKEYDRYIESTLSIGACPAVSLVTHFDKNDSLLKGKDEPYTMSAGTWVRGIDRFPQEQWFGPIRYRYNEKHKVWEYDSCSSREMQNNIENYPDVEWLDESQAASPAGDGWISVEDGLPPKFKNVLALSKLGRIRITCVDSSGKLDLFELEVDNGDYYTHWCYFPKRPNTK